MLTVWQVGNEAGQGRTGTTIGPAVTRAIVRCPAGAGRRADRGHRAGRDRRWRDAGQAGQRGALDARVWSDSFTGPAGSGINQRSWAYQTGYGIFGDGEIETITSSPGNVHLDGRGDLDITAVRQGPSWTSGRIRTRRTFSAPAGGELMVTASIRQPGPAGGTGYWPAFWLLGNLTQGNPDGTFGPCHEQNVLGSGLRPCPGCQRGYHRYAVVIGRRDAAHQQIRWYLDGHQFFRLGESRVGAVAWRTAFDHGLAIILDLAMGGAYPDTVCGCRAPAISTTPGGTLSVRYVAVYRGY